MIPVDSSFIQSFIQFVYYLSTVLIWYCLAVWLFNYEYILKLWYMCCSIAWFYLTNTLQQVASLSKFYHLGYLGHGPECTLSQVSGSTVQQHSTVCAASWSLPSNGQHYHKRLCMRNRRLPRGPQLIKKFVRDFEIFRFWNGFQDFTMISRFQPRFHQYLYVNSSSTLLHSMQACGYTAQTDRFPLMVGKGVSSFFSKHATKCCLMHFLLFKSAHRIKDHFQMQYVAVTGRKRTLFRF